MKKYITNIIEQLKLIYPGEQIAIINGFIGVKSGDRLKHTSYLGNAYFEIDGVIYTDYSGKDKRLLTIK